MSDSESASQDGDRGIYAGRIGILYALGRHYLSLPFAALCVSAKLFGSGNEGIFPFLPLVLLIVVAIAAEQLTEAYKRQAPGEDAHFWAGRYVFVSAVAGASWGVGVFFWFVPNSFPAQAYLCLAYMGMTATEFIARSAHRPAYLAHAAFSLGPLILMLLIHGGLYSTMSAVLVFCFAAVLVSYANAMARLLDESIQAEIRQRHTRAQPLCGKATGGSRSRCRSIQRQRQIRLHRKYQSRATHAAERLARHGASCWTRPISDRRITTTLK